MPVPRPRAGPRRAHRDRADRAERDTGCRADRAGGRVAARCGHPVRARRLRHREREHEPVAAPASGRREDRPLLHPRNRARPAQVRGREGDAALRAGERRATDRGRHRERMRPDRRARHGHLLRAGLPARPTGRAAVAGRRAGRARCDPRAAHCGVSRRDTHRAAGRHDRREDAGPRAGPAARRDQQRRARPVQPDARPARGRAGRTRSARRARESPRLHRPLRAAVSPRGVREEAVPAVRERRAADDRQRDDVRAARDAAREPRPALSRGWLRDHRTRPLRRARHRREPRARGDRDAHRSRALREPADVPARQHPDQRAYRPPAPARCRLSCVLRRPEPVQAVQRPVRLLAGRRSAEVRGDGAGRRVRPAARLSRARRRRRFPRAVPARRLARARDQRDRALQRRRAALLHAGRPAGRRAARRGPTRQPGVLRLRDDGDRRGRRAGRRAWREALRQRRDRVGRGTREAARETAAGRARGRRSRRGPRRAAQSRRTAGRGGDGGGGLNGGQSSSADTAALRATETETETGARPSTSRIVAHRLPAARAGRRARCADDRNNPAFRPLPAPFPPVARAAGCTHDYLAFFAFCLVFLVTAFSQISA
ncbi:hypothetical protein EMIT0111MI5_330025 [Burkholderia sp. IT-111MI5]